MRVVGRFDVWEVEDSKFSGGGGAELFWEASRRFVYKRYWDQKTGRKRPVLEPWAVGQIHRLCDIGREVLITRGQDVGSTPEASVNWPIDMVATSGGGVEGVILPAIPRHFFTQQGTPRHLDFLYIPHHAPREAVVRIPVLIRLAEILNWLDAKDLVHGDFSSKNVVWCQSPQPGAYLIDADGLQPRHPPPTTGFGTDFWKDPRVIDKQIPAHDHYSDWYALALAIYRGLWLTPGVLTKEAGSWQPPKNIPSNAPSNLRALLIRSLGSGALDPSVRASPQEWVEALVNAYVDGDQYNKKALNDLDAHTESRHRNRQRHAAAAFQPLPPIPTVTPPPPSPQTRPASLRALGTNIPGTTPSPSHTRTPPATTQQGQMQQAISRLQTHSKLARVLEAFASLVLVPYLTVMTVSVFVASLWFRIPAWLFVVSALLYWVSVVPTLWRPGFAQGTPITDRHEGAMDIMVRVVTWGHRRWPWLVLYGALFTVVTGALDSDATDPDLIAQTAPTTVASTSGLTATTTPAADQRAAAASDDSAGANLSGIVFARGADPRGLELYIVREDGSAAQSVGGVDGVASPAVSPDGRSVAVSIFGTFGWRVHVVNADGEDSGPICPNRAGSPCRDPSWSPDGTKLAYTCGRNVCLMNSDGSSHEELTLELDDAFHPSYSPAGLSIVFVGVVGTDEDLYRYDIPTRTVERLTTLDGALGDPTWSPDGSAIAFTRYSEGRGFRPADIHTLHIDSTSVSNLTQTESRDSNPSWSPDGSQIVFLSDRNDLQSERSYPPSQFPRPQLFLMSSTGGDQRIFFEGEAYDPHWSPHLDSSPTSDGFDSGLETASVAGVWIVTYEVSRVTNLSEVNVGDTESRVWTIEYLCGNEDAPCGFRIESALSSDGASYSTDGVFQGGVYSWVGSEQKIDCVDLEDGAIIAADVYTGVQHTEFRVASAVPSDDRLAATELVGTIVTEYELEDPDLEDECAPDVSIALDVQAGRVDP